MIEHENINRWIRTYLFTFRMTLDEKKKYLKRFENSKHISEVHP